MKTIIYMLITLSLPLYAQSTLTQTLKERADRSAAKSPPSVKLEFQRALNELKASGIEKTAIQKGTNAPSFKIDGKSFSSYYTEKPVILKFYRGSWCPYCQIEMKAYEEYKARFEAKGYQIIVLTPDTKVEIAKFRDKQKITIPIYSDKENAIAKKFGIAFKLDKKLSKVYKDFGIDLKKSQENDLDELPLPGTYVINKKGKITYAFIDADYKLRQDPGELLRILKR